MSIRKNVKILHKFFKKLGWTYDFNEEEHLFRSGVQLGNGLSIRGDLPLGKIVAAVQNFQKAQTAEDTDGLMQRRSDATATWEVTQVNELLSCMERFGGIMVGATNLMDRLDPAVLRRFTYKVEFGYLENAGKRIFFERAFRSSLSGEELRRLEGISNLAPGDFKTVSQKLFYLGEAVGNAERLAALEQEVALKVDGSFVCRGFAA